MLTHRVATEADLSLLAEWNHRLIRDEGHRNPMTDVQLRDRMAAWLGSGEYEAVIFAEEKPVAYALYKREPESIYLRQFFVLPERRRAGVGREAFALLRNVVWPSNVRLTVEVLTINVPAVEFWRAVGYRDYSLTLEIMPPT